MSAQNYFLSGPTAPDVRKNAISFLNRLDLAKPWKITVEAHKKSKSRKQTNALWGVAYPVIAKHYGYAGRAEIEYMHTCFCGDYWGWKTVLGHAVPVRTTTTNEEGEKEDCSAEDMSGIYALVQRTAASDGCDVPDPDPLWFQSARFDRD